MTQTIQHTVTVGYGENEREVTFDIPAAVVAAASAAAYEEDREMIVGEHPYFGWVYRAAEDTGAVAELVSVFNCNAEGLCP